MCETEIEATKHIRHQACGGSHQRVGKGRLSGKAAYKSMLLSRKAEQLLRAGVGSWTSYQSSHNTISHFLAMTVMEAFSVIHRLFTCSLHEYS